MSKADPIPAVREEDAAGETAAIFADLRATLGVPFVNLIWRHLATIPGGLAATWSLVRPFYLSGRLKAAQAELRAGLALPEILPIEDFALACAGLSREDQNTIAAMLRDYNSANAANFLALLAARSALRGEGTSEAPSPLAAAQGAAASAGAQTALPRLLGLDELSPPLLALVLSLDGFARLGQSDAVASLYRHLAHWPAFLALAHVALLPHQRGDAFRAPQEEIIARGRDIAATLRPALAAAPADLSPASRDAVLAALDDFTRLMIGRMIVMGSALAALLPPQAGSTAGRS